MLALALAAVLAQEPTLHESIERVVSVELARPESRWQIEQTPRGGRATVKIRLPYYAGILALDWMSTELCCGSGPDETIVQPDGQLVPWRSREVNPLPLMGSSLGRAFTMGTLAVGWELLDKYLARHWQLGRRLLRISFVLYAVPQINTNLGFTRHAIGWEPPINPMSLIPAGWRR